MSSADVRNAFQRDGFVGPLDIISKEDAEIALKQVQIELSAGTCRFKLHLILPSISDIAHHPKLVRAVQQALDSDKIWLWSSDINIKQANSSGYFAPHQDCTYAGLTPSYDCLTAWVALSDPVGELEGCLSFYPMSHKLKQLPHQTTHLSKNKDSNLLSMGQYIDSDIMQTLPKPVSIKLLGGQATLHSFNCVHSSGPNNSGKPRVGLALRYITGNVIQTKAVREMVTWISGDSSSHPSFDVEPRLQSSPTEEDIERGREVQKEELRREETNYFADASTKRMSYS